MTCLLMHLGFSLQGDAAPHAEAPPADRPDLPQFEDASDDAALNAASAWEPVSSCTLDL